MQASRSALLLFGLLTALMVSGCGSVRNVTHALKNRDANTGADAQAVRKIVVLRPDSPSPAAVAASAESELNGVKGFIFNEAIRGFSITLSETAAMQLADDPSVAYMVDDRALFNTAVSAPTIVQTPQAETVPTNISRVLANTTRSFAAQADVDATVAVLDTGIDVTHPDLNVVESVSFVGDSSRGNDVYGHGTHVAGTIAARFNDQGIVGVAPGARLWAVKVLDDEGSGFLSQIIAGIEYVTQNANKIDVVNMSLGGIGDSGTSCDATSQDPYHQALCNSIAKGIVYVAAAGNNAADGSNFLPAAYPEVIGVSAIVDTDGQGGGKGPATTRGNDDAFAKFSNFGTTIDFAAPGVSVLSTYPQGQYARISGTSMASPHVAGAAALYIARNRASKPTRAAELAGYANVVKAALVTAGIQANDPAYFTGDPDRYAEALLNVSALDPKLDPSLTLTVAFDKTAYEKDKDLSAAVALRLSDEYGAGVTGLPAENFVFEVNGKELSPVDIAFVASTTIVGGYVASLDLSNLAVGLQTLKVTVKDTRALTQIGLGTFDITPNQDQLIRVTAVRYTTGFTSSRRRFVRIVAEVRNGNNALVSGVKTSVQVDYQTVSGLFSRRLGTATAVSDTQSLARFIVKNALTGCYLTTITRLEKTGYTWDKARDTFTSNSCGTSTRPGGAAETPTKDSPVQNSPVQNTIEAVQDTLSAE